MTQQPIKGRKAGGGIRFGEMERDSLLAHGVASLVYDRLNTGSDNSITYVCTQCGSLLSPILSPVSRETHGNSTANISHCSVCTSTKGIEKVVIPFVFRYLTSELAAMNIQIDLRT